jgi:hypothetical protein
MTALDPVEWSDIEAVRGRPAANLTPYVERMQDSVADDSPFVAAKTIYDTWKSELGSERSTPDQGAAFIITYLLERSGTLALDDGDEGTTPSVVTDRRPPPERLRQWFWEREHTMWWIAIQTGVHWSLVNYWLWEDDIPLMERNFLDETLQEIETYRRTRDDL